MTYKYYQIEDGLEDEDIIVELEYAPTKVKYGEMVWQVHGDEYKILQSELFSFEDFDLMTLDHIIGGLEDYPIDAILVVDDISYETYISWWEEPGITTLNVFQKLLEEFDHSKPTINPQDKADLERLREKYPDQFK